MEFTKEQLIEQAKGCRMLAQCAVDARPDDMAAAKNLALFEIALASLEAEPILNMQFKNGWPVDGTAGIISGSPSFPDGYHDFYAIPQPAPVVRQIMRELVPLLDEDQFARIENIALSAGVMPPRPAPVVSDCGRDQFEEWMLRKWGRERQEYDFMKVKFRYGEDYADSYTRLMWKAWSAGSAAMLQAGNSPVTPDIWIPVSERMPDDSSDVLCTAEFYGPGDWRIKVGYWREGEWVVYGASWTPTHWMPLPVAPQREVT